MYNFEVWDDTPERIWIISIIVCIWNALFICCDVDNFFYVGSKTIILNY